MNLWQIYNPCVSLADTLRKRSALPIDTGDDKALFALLKRQLTRRELRCFVMAESGADEGVIAERLGCDTAAIERLRDNVSVKLRRPAFASALAALKQHNHR